MKKVEIESSFRKEYKVASIRENVTLTEDRIIKEYQEIRFVVVDTQKPKEFIEMCNEHNLSEADYYEVFFSDKAESVYIHKEALRSLLSTLLASVIHTRGEV
jgi:hypothetical protein